MVRAGQGYVTPQPARLATLNTWKEVPAMTAPDSTTSPVGCKRCNACLQVKPLSDFHNNSRAEDGKVTRCKPCTKVTGKAWRKATYDRVCRISREWPTSLPVHPNRPGVSFKDSSEYEGIRVGDDGSVWSCRGSRGLFGEYWYELKQLSAHKGHLFVAIGVSTGKSVNRFVHQLVLETFIGPRPPGMEVRHVINNDPTDNRLVNLAWGTPSENTADKWRHGTMPAGSKQWNAKLKEEDIPIIRALVRSGVRYGEIGLKFGISKTVVCSIMKGKSWSHVKD
jgi:hypothetical protein